MQLTTLIGCIVGHLPILISVQTLLRIKFKIYGLCKHLF